ncbi:MAG: mechanosensitive ion channel family protein [Oscillospiraceae bacterium]|nr:mechanosensitive ion channel family protein [Oscillospiraceae bacterium]
MLERIKSWALSLGALAVDKLLPAVIILVIGILVIRIVMTIINRALHASKLEKAAHSLIKSLASVVMYLLLGLMVASSLGIDVTGIIAMASVLSLAVSLAVQDLLSNVIGGFTLLYTHPFKSGDFVEIAGKSGTVEEVGMSYTVLATPDNKRISIPNSSVVKGDIVNYTVTGTRRLDIQITASYDAPVQKVIDALLQAGTMDNVLLDPAPMAAVENYGESAIAYVLRVWTKTDDYWPTLYAINQKIKTIFDETGIEMTYPHLNVHVKQ